jgi:hypothetical protein
MRLKHHLPMNHHSRAASFINDGGLDFPGGRLDSKPSDPLHE